MKLQDYAPYYIGCRCLNTRFSEDEPEYNRGWFLRVFRTSIDAVNPYGLETEDQVYLTGTDSIKLILRLLEDMTETEMIGLIQTSLPDKMEDKPTDDDYDIELFYNDDGLMVDNDVLIGASYSCRCYEGQIAIKECGTIFYHHEESGRSEGINSPACFHYLLKHGFDLFGLINAGLAIDAATLPK